jgi:hypothetical protein
MIVRRARRFGLSLLGARLRRVLLLTGLVFAALQVGSAAATTIGQTGGSTTCSPNGVGTAAADTKYVIPPGGGRITSFSFQSTNANAGQKLDFLLLRPAPGGNYIVVGQTLPVTLAGTGAETFPANIPAQPGDIMGIWVNAPLNNCLSLPGSGAITTSGPQPEPFVGDTVQLPKAGSFGLNEAANLAPAPLAGETFTVQGDQDRESTFTGSCNVRSNAGSFNFDVRGTAAGPFPGTFEERGSFSTRSPGFLTSFSSNFTITDTSGAVTVTGSETLAGGSNASRVSCTQLGESNIDVSGQNLATAYTATIGGSQHDSGSAMVTIDGVLGVGSGTASFSEDFGSIGVLPPLPTSKDQCRHDGWRTFAVFKNQGDCVSFVAAGGKNPANG